MNRDEILRLAAERLGIARLNTMQQQVLEAGSHGGDLMVLAPTGSGKTLAFATLLLEAMQPQRERLQAVVIAPSRELVMQIHGVLQTLAAGIKVTCCYGGHSVADERQSLQVVPGIVVATPGRLLDHARRGHIDIGPARWLVLDEFDKTLELGFDDEMRQLLRLMPDLDRRVLTSATRLDELPDFVRLTQPLTLDFLQHMDNAPASRMKVWTVEADGKDKLATLRRLLLSRHEGKAIVFVNFRDTVLRVHDALRHARIASTAYHGGMEQVEREKAVAMFNNGSAMVLVTTDLASRGLDIAGVSHIVHYHLPTSAEAYTHRNGRTARVEATGEVYVLLAPGEQCPGYVDACGRLDLPEVVEHRGIEAPMATLHIKAGRKEKISRADVVGFIANNSGVEAKQIGRIDLHDHYTLVAVPRAVVHVTLQQLQAAKIKGHRVRITLAGV